jgi:hypothetical protein
MKTKIILAFTSTLISAPLANAAISLLSGGSGAFSEAPTAVTYPYTALSSFDASTASKVVFTLSDELGSGDTLPTSITFGGVAMTLAVGNNNSIQHARIYYLDASSVGGGTFGTGDLVVTGTGSNDFAGSWLFLAGTADGVGPTNSSLTQSVSLTTVTDGSWVVASHANNGTSGTAQSPLTVLLDGDAGSAGGGSGYAEIATGAAGTYSFTGSTSRPVTMAAAFQAVPEPSTTALLGLGGLALIMRRCK